MKQMTNPPSLNISNSWFSHIVPISLDEDIYLLFNFTAQLFTCHYRACCLTVHCNGYTISNQKKVQCRYQWRHQFAWPISTLQKSSENTRRICLSLKTHVVPTWVLKRKSGWKWPCTFGNRKQGAWKGSEIYHWKWRDKICNSWRIYSTCYAQWRSL